MSGPSLMYYNESLGKTAARQLTIAWQITAAVTVASRPLGVPALTAFGAIASQSVIDTFLGTTSEFDYLAFDATAMGADAMGVIVNMSGQAKDLICVETSCYSNTGFADQVLRVAAKSTALTASTLITEAALGASGNIAYKVNFGNTPDFDGLTSGLIISKIFWIAK